MRSVIESNPNPPYNKAQALRLYVEKSDMDARVGEDMERYRDSGSKPRVVRSAGLSRFPVSMRRFMERLTRHTPLPWLDWRLKAFLERVRENTGTTERRVVSLGG